MTWWRNADMVFKYADTQYAAHGRPAQCAGLLVQAASRAAHAVLAARGEWVTNEKALLSRAGLGEIDHVVAELWPEPAALRAAVDRAMVVCATALGDSRR